MRRLFVVLVADFPDDFLEQVLHGDEAARSAVFVDDDGDVELVALHLAKHFEQSARFRHEQNVSTKRLEGLQIFGVRSREEVLRVEVANDLVEAATAREHEARVALSPNGREGFGARRVDGKGGDVDARNHRVFRGANAEAKHPLEQHAPVFVVLARGGVRHEETEDIFFGKRAFVREVRGEPERPEDHAAADLEDVKQGPKAQAEKAKREGGGEGGSLRALNRHELRNEFAEEHVGEREHREADRGRGHVKHRAFRRCSAERGHRQDRALREGLADPAKAEACERDADLRHREVAIESLEDVSGGDGARVTAACTRVHTGRTDLYEGKLGRNEKAVEGNQRYCERKVEHGASLAENDAEREPASRAKMLKSVGRWIPCPSDLGNLADCKFVCKLIWAEVRLVAPPFAFFSFFQGFAMFRASSVSSVALRVFLPLLAACTGGSLRPSGDLEVTTQGDLSVEDGIPATDFADGWAVRFERFVVNVGGIALGVDSASVVPLGEEPYVLVDHAVPGPKTVLIAQGVIAGDWPAFTYQLRPIRATTTLGGGTTDDDLMRMRMVAASTLVKGVATKGNTTKTFEWLFSLATAYEGCRVMQGTTITRGVYVRADATTGVDLPGSARPLFEEDLSALKPALRFEALANADVNGDGAISLAELDALAVADVRASIGHYGAGTYININTMRDYISAQARRIGGFRGIGSCQFKRL